MKCVLLIASFIFTCPQALRAQLPDGKTIESITQQLQQILDRLDAIEVRLERLENAIDLDSPRPSGIIFTNEIDAGSILQFQSEIRDWCREPKLEIGVDRSKNAIVFKNFESSTAATIAKINAWIRNAPSGKLKKRMPSEILMRSRLE